MTCRCDRCGKLMDDADVYYSPVTDMPLCDECYWEEEEAEEDGDAC